MGKIVKNRPEKVQQLLITKSPTSLLAEDFPEYLKRKFLNNKSETKPKLLEMIFYDDDEDNSKTWVVFAIDGTNVITFMQEKETCTAKSMLEKAGLMVSEDFSSAIVGSSSESLNFKIRIQESDDESPENLECSCFTKSNVIAVNYEINDVPFTSTYIQPSLIKPGYVVECAACYQTSFNHKSCDHCFYIFKKPIESIPINIKKCDETEISITKIIDGFKVEDFVGIFKTNESQINLRQKNQEKNSQLKLEIWNTKDELQKLKDRFLELKVKNLLTIP